MNTDKLVNRFERIKVRLAKAQMEMDAAKQAFEKIKYDGQVYDTTAEWKLLCEATGMSDRCEVEDFLC